MMIYRVRTDISKDEFIACLQRYLLLEQTHEVLARKKFANKPLVFNALIKWVRRHARSRSAPLRFTMEATGIY